MKNLRFYVNEKGEKIYTLKSEVNNLKTKEAHYKFIKLGRPKEKFKG